MHLLLEERPLPKRLRPDETLSLIASTMAWVYADEMAGIGEVDHRGSLEDVLQVVFRILAEYEGKSL